MAINRGPWNALVDDDGSNLTGSIWNKAAIKTVLLDPIDAAVITQVILSSATGTVNDWVPAGYIAGTNALINLNGTGDLTVTGLAAGVPGQVVTFKNTRTSGVVAFPHYHAGSATTARFANSVESAPTRIAAGGWIQYMFIDLWVLVGHEQGIPIAIPFTAGNYTGQGVITAAMVGQHDYYLNGRTCTGTVAVNSFPGLTSSASFNVAGWPYTRASPGRYDPGVGSINGAWGAIMADLQPTAVAFTRWDFGNYTAGPHYVFYQATWTVS
jgi:hypothetical protein